ncbi:MAG: DUF3443 domain-containing protein [Gammaproteobacteria bacterium]|nr:DUF3443 domain-containing protein [Gammaproteobacteria bacterium]
MRSPLSIGTRGLLAALLVAGCGLLTACGGGSSGGFAGVGGGGSSGGGGGGTPGLNTVPVVVDQGPAAAGGSTNVLYTTVTLCAPGSTTQCQTIDHVQVDTGSTGFRVLASVLGTGLQATDMPQSSDVNGHPLDECTQFADGYSWGTVRTADLVVGNETAASLPIQVIGDPAAATVPASCVQGPQENTVQTFGANAILGIGNFLTDCGAACAAGAVSGAYYDCPPTGTCAPVAVALSAQVQNPVSFFAADNNGVVIDLPAASSPTATLAGTLIFGIGTQSDNAMPANAGIYTLDPNYGTLSTTYNGTNYSSSFIDSGSNAYFFTDDTIPTCTSQTSFYCPSATETLQGLIQGQNGATAAVSFSVDNALTDFATNFPVLPNLAGPAGSTLSGAFDWGLPFFYGRPVYVAFESNTAAGVAGPWVGF